MAGPSINSDYLQTLHAAVGQCLLKHQPRLRRQLAALRKYRMDAPRAESLAASLQRDIRASQDILAQRAAQSAPIMFPDALPICRAREEICAALTKHPVLIVCGETGSGKTTQLPKICLEMGRGLLGQIGHTQPRRIAARSVARRIAAELESEIGGVVGYQTRFDKSVTDASRIKLMTDGILLSELRHDRQLRQYDTLIIDEAHERSLNIDFLLGYLRTLIERRKDLKLIITSATIDTDKFSRHFAGAPVLEISGRTFPVDIEYLPQGADEERDTSELVADAVAVLLARQDRRGRGDILVFLPGERHISECRDLLRRQFREQLEILPLFGRLSAGDQDRVFRSGGRTRCVLATNIAETSLTVPGIRYVIDTGLARVSRYSVRSKVQQLPVEKISQASANQRAGRCGRLENGLALRLYSEEDFGSRPPHTEPEIQRTNLARVILEMATLRLGDIEAFPFVDQPDARYVRDGYRLLQELQAVDDAGKVLPPGREMARLPVDPRIARMLLAARQNGCMSDMLVVAAGLTTPDPRQRPVDKREAADLQHAKFADPHSDFVGLLNLWQGWKAEQQAGSGGALRRWCKQHFLSYTRMREWQDLVHQLHGLSTDTRSAAADGDRYASLHRSLLTGLLGHIGLRNEQGAYQGTRGRVFHVFPGSGTRKSALRWIVAAQLMETSRLFAHIVARVQPEWIEEAAGHLVKRSHDVPVWQPRRGRVVARETVTLYGLVLATGRQVNYASIDPDAARQVFIREALVGQRLNFPVGFLADNLQLMQDIEALEHRSRRHDILADEDVQCAFYAERLAHEIRDAASLKKWLRTATPDALNSMRMSKELLMQHSASDVTIERFPDTLEVAGNAIQLEYHFERGSACDGVTAVIPLKLLNPLPVAVFDYLVPGLLPEKVECLLRGLPKKLRRQFVPVPRFAQAALEDLDDKHSVLEVWLANKLHRMCGSPVTPADLSAAGLPDHLRMRFRLIDEGGEVIAEGRDLTVLKEQFGKLARQAASQGLTSELGRGGIRRWDFGDLPEHVESDRDGERLTLFPALEATPDCVNLVFHDDAQAAARLTVGGIVRLAQLALPQQFDLIRKDLRAQSKALLGWRRFGTEAQLAAQIFEHLARNHLQEGKRSPPRSQSAFSAWLDTFRSALADEAATLITLLAQVLALDNVVRLGMTRLDSGDCEAVVADVNDQLNGLMYATFIGETEGYWLARYPVYLEALSVRLDRLPAQLAQDGVSMTELAQCKQRLASIASERPEWLGHSDVREYRWLIEEFRVSLFAQKLGTVRKVSAVRLQRFWENKIAAQLVQAGGLPPD